MQYIFVFFFYKTQQSKIFEKRELTYGNKCCHWMILNKSIFELNFHLLCEHITIDKTK